MAVPVSYYIQYSQKITNLTILEQLEYNNGIFVYASVVIAKYSIHANSTDFLSLLPPTDFRCFPTDLKKKCKFFFIVNCSHVDYSC